MKHPKLSFKIRSARSEFNYVHDLVMGANFYHRYNYQVKLPEDRPFQIKISEDNWPEAWRIFKRQVYRAKDYRAELEICKVQCGDLLVIWPQLAKFQKEWGFRLFAKYQIELTKYGPGGSYFTREQKVRIRVQDKTDGSPDYHDRVLHEIVHIGLDWLVKQHKLDHSEKEGLVNSLCRYLLDGCRDELPDNLKELIS